MSLFIAAADRIAQGLAIFGEKGTLELTEAGVGENRVSLFFALVRNIPDERLKTLMLNIVQEAQTSPPEIAGSIIADLFVLTFQTRNCRGGKGERALFYKMLLLLNEIYPETTSSMLSLLGNYGYYKDYFNLLTLIGKEEISLHENLRTGIITIVAHQLQQDSAELLKPVQDRKISLCAKYVPREYGKFAIKDNKPHFKALLRALFPETRNPKELYRKLISSICQHLDITETKMCAKRFSEIDFKRVPSVCANKMRKAFLNEDRKNQPTPQQKETGNRFPDDEDRVMCRAHFLDTIIKNKVQGKQVFPHTIVQDLSSGRSSEAEKLLFNAQWTNIRQGLLDKIALKNAELVAAGKTPSKSLDKLVPLVDVSGSMSGTPMMVAVALGILTSEINHPAFRHRFITFETTPQWVVLNPESSIAEKVTVTMRAPWGGTTNVEAAFALIAKVIEDNHLPMEEVPDLIIFSDMQFDVAVGGSSQSVTQLERVQKRFHDLGIRVSGQPYPAPRIVFWNLRGDTRGYPASADSSNVQMLSGFSPSMLEAVLVGDEVEVVEEVVEVAGEAKAVVAKPAVNPYTTLRKVLDDTVYDEVRVRCSTSEEGLLAAYSFTPAPPPEITAPVEGAENP